MSKLKLDEERKEWVAAYQFNTFVGKLIDNYFQARGCMTKMEVRLEWTGRLEESIDSFRITWTGEFLDINS